MGRFRAGTSLATTALDEGFSLAAMRDGTGRRHAIVASNWGLIDYSAVGGGAWHGYFLGAY
jgi:hypothetical protein